MPGEDELLEAKAKLTGALADIFNVFNNFLTTREVPVEKGDTLWGLAVKHLGDGQRWREIYLCNLDTIFRYQKIYNDMQGDPDMIYEGQTLRVLAF